VPDDEDSFETAEQRPQDGVNRQAPRSPRPRGLEGYDPALADLTTVLTTFLRLIRAKQGRGTAGADALDDFHQGITRLIADRGEVTLRVGVDGLYSGDRNVLEVSPHEDPVIFKVFQNGIRLLTFLPEIDRDEIESFVEVLTVSLTDTEGLENDISTLLADRDFKAIRYVVIDSFTESAVDGYSSGGAVEISDIVATALRRELGEHVTESGAGSGGGMQFWDADLTFLRESRLREMVAALPGEASRMGHGGQIEQEAGVFRESLTSALEHWTGWLPKAVFTTLRGASQAEAESIVDHLGSELLDVARGKGIAAALPRLEETVRWTEAHGDEPIASSMSEAVFSSGMRALAVMALRTSDDASIAAAMFVLGQLDASERGKALSDISRLQPSATRSAAIQRIMTPPCPELSQVAAMIGGMDREAARIVLDALRDEPFSDDRFSLHASAASNTAVEVRALALRWLAHHGGKAGEDALRIGLEDRHRDVRLAALFLLTTVKPPYAARLVTERFFNHPTFRKAPLHEKRLCALALAQLAGQQVVPRMRKLLTTLNVTGSTKTDEMRAAAAVALGMLRDVQSADKIGKLSRSRLCGTALREECKTVAAALKAGREPTSQPLRDLERLAVQLGLADAREERLAPPTPVPDDQTHVDLQQTEGMIPLSDMGTAAHELPATILPAPEIVDALLAVFSFDDIPVCETELSRTRGS